LDIKVANNEIFRHADLNFLPLVTARQQSHPHQPLAKPPF
jgi:hypothetical protein